MEPDRRIRRVAVVGGGSAGWLAAVALSRKLGAQCSVHVIDSPDSPVGGFGESSIPSILEFLRFAGIDQNDFVDKTQATYDLGIRFNEWRETGHGFWHPYGAFGTLIERRPFHHFWHKAKAAGLNPRVEFFSLEIAMSMANRFIFPTNSLGIAQNLRYALHFDPVLAARYLRAVAERAGVIRLDRKVVSASLREDGGIDELTFEDGGKLRADLYIDCSGFQGTLIEETLHSGYQDWSAFLPCDREVSVTTPIDVPRLPYTTINARAAGWQWRIPLQQRLAAGYVYSSAHASDETALRDLLDGGIEPLGQPRVTQFTNGHRRQPWSRNCVALGAAAGFIEPLESTSAHLVINSLYTLLDHFPDKSFDPANIASYNALIVDEFERVRDFIILHYCTTQRADAPLWEHCRNMPIPDTLRQRLDHYRASGRVVQRGVELFSDLSWFWVLEGMGITPRDYDPLVDMVDFEQVKRLMLAINQKVASDVTSAPTHDSFFAAANARLAANAPLRRQAAGGGSGQVN